MSSIARRFVGSPKYQGAGERVAYTITTTRWGSSPTSVVVELFDEQGVDVSATKLSGVVTVVGDEITTPLVIGLAAGERYRLTAQFVVDGNTLSAWGEIIGEE